MKKHSHCNAYTHTQAMDFLYRCTNYSRALKDSRAADMGDSGDELEGAVECGDISEREAEEVRCSVGGVSCACNKC